MRAISPTSILTILAVALALTTAPLALLASTNCYAYNGSNSSCNSSQYCSERLITGAYYCKQICSPYPDLGCCHYYDSTYQYYDNGQQGGTCACNGQQYDVIASVTNNGAQTCYQSNGIQYATCEVSYNGGYCQ